MKKYLYLFFLLCGVVLLTGGGSAKKSDAAGAAESRGEGAKVTKVNPRDSVLWCGWSPEQRQVYARMGRMIAAHVKSVDGRLEFALPEAEFRKMNMPDTIYRQLLPDLKRVNRWMDSTNMPAVERAEMCDDYVAAIKQFVVDLDAFCKAKGFPTDWESQNK